MIVSRISNSVLKHGDLSAATFGSYPNPKLSNGHVFKTVTLNSNTVESSLTSL